MSYPPKVLQFIDDNIQDKPSNLARKVLIMFPDFDKSHDKLRNSIAKRKKKILSAIKDNATEHGLDVADVHSGWLKNKDSSFYFKNPDLDKDFQERFKAELIESIQGHSPNYVSIIREKCIDGHLLVLDPADIHIGKLCDSFESGEDYNNEIAVSRVLKIVTGKHSNRCPSIHFSLIIET